MTGLQAAGTGVGGSSAALKAANGGRRIASSHPDFAEVYDFLLDEAALLDGNDLDAWFQLLAEDLVYRIPVRRIVSRHQGPGFDPVMAHLDDDHAAMANRIERLRSASAWVEDPPSLVRRFVTNARLTAARAPGELAVNSYVLALRSQWTKAPFDILSMERHDVLRRSGRSFEIARRTIFFDQSPLETPNLPLFF